jgi:hypothetical protein
MTPQKPRKAKIQFPVTSVTPSYEVMSLLSVRALVFDMAAAARGMTIGDIN